MKNDLLEKDRLIGDLELQLSAQKVDSVVVGAVAAYCLQCGNALCDVQSTKLLYAGPG